MRNSVRPVFAGLAAAMASLAPCLASASGVAPADLSSLSIEELGNVQVTSVSKRAEPVAQAASAIYVITHDDIVRSGATRIPEILRLAPNLQVARIGADQYAISARGLNGNPALQNFSDKLLVMIDGRSVYTPIFSGVYWDMQDVLPEDIERIEVISGPGATLWGANAVNGVINIITRNAADTQGGFAQVGVGDRQRSGSLRYGGRIGGDISYRVYARAYVDDDLSTPAGAPVRNHLTQPQIGFRLDWTPSAADAVTLQGDAYDGHEVQAVIAPEDISGRNLTARWSHTWAGGSTLQVQAYYDRAHRGPELFGVALTTDTYDIDLQHSFSLGDRNQVVWGGGLRNTRYKIINTPSLQFAPPNRSLGLSNLFAQDTLTINSATRLTVGVKLEDDPYVSPVLLPNARLSWSPNGAVTLWGAVSRAVRSATPFDRDVVEVLGGGPFLVGGADFQSEKLTAYEAGARFTVSSRAAVSVSTYYNRYDDLRSIELTPVTVLPLRWDNLMRGRTYGVEAWGDYQLTPWWRLSAAFDVFHGDFEFKPGSSGLGGLGQSGDDPKYQASLKSSMDIGPRLTLDADLRYVAALPDPRVPGYVELNGRMGWNISDRVQLSLSAYNLLHDSHQEYPGGAAIPRSVFADVRWRF